MREKLLDFLHNLTNYDYVLFASLFILFLLLLVLTVFIRKYSFLSILTLFISLFTLFVAPFIGYKKLHQYLYPTSNSVKEVKALNFTPALVVLGTLTNESQKDYSICKVTLSLHKVAHNALLDPLFKLNPFQKTSIIEHNIAPKEERSLKILVEPFSYKKDYNVTIGADCR